ncbi:MAG: hypothetical protein AB8G15_00295 [Saprospiraceae bacterium]
MEFLTQLFTQLNTEDSIKVLAFLFVAFLIGWIFSHWAKAGRIRKLKKALKDKEDELITLGAKHKTLVEEFELKDADLKKAQLAQEEAQSTIERLEREHRQIGQEFNLLRQKNNQFQSEQKEYEAQIESLNTQIIGLRAQHNQSGTSTGTSSHETGISAANLSTLESNYKHHDTRLELLEAKLNNLSQENQALKNSIHQIKTTSTSSTGISTVTEPSKDTDEKSLVAKAVIKNMIGSRIVKVNAANKDNLQLINGVGPFIEEKLNEIGIYAFEQIEQFDDEIIEKVTEAIQFFPGRIKRDDWVGQASELFNMN